MRVWVGVWNISWILLLLDVVIFSKLVFWFVSFLIIDLENFLFILMVIFLIGFKSVLFVFVWVIICGFEIVSLKFLWCIFLIRMFSWSLFCLVILNELVFLVLFMEIVILFLVWWNKCLWMMCDWILFFLWFVMGELLIDRVMDKVGGLIGCVVRGLFILIV